MKRLIFACLLITLAAVFAANTASAAGEFSKPILIGGDNSSANQDPQTVTEATSLKAIIHPLSQPADKNFKIIDGKIQPDGLDAIYVDDVAATPGFTKEPPTQVQANSPMIEHAQSRFNPALKVQAIGPEDIVLEKDILGTITKTTYQFEGVIGGNYESHRMVLGDIREVNPANEFQTLFGQPPLEEVLIGGVLTPLIGNANEDGPYYANTYPATIIADPATVPFKWCPFNFLPFKKPPDYPCWGQPTFSDDEYKSVYLFDVVDLGNGLMSASYDPLYLSIRTIYELITEEQISPVGPDIISPFTHNTYLYSYFSPLTLFRKVEDPNDIRFRFSGYSSFEFPYIKCEKTCNTCPTICTADWWKLLPSNWIIPVATNPISVEAIDLGGKASWQVGGDPTVPHPDRDLAVTYTSTLFDMNKYVPDGFGRPAVFDSSYYKFRDLLGTCDGPCSPVTFKPLKKERFPDDVVSIALFNKQVNKWAEGADNQPYINANASHIFDVEFWGLIGKGVYDTAVLTDFAEDAVNRKQYLLVPSIAADPSDPNNAVIYIVDKDPLTIDKNRIYFKRPWSEETDGFNIFAPPNFNPIKPFCQKSYGTDFKRTPIILPAFVPIERAGAGFVPYQIRTGNLDGDKCDDFIITWRGKHTIKNTVYPAYVQFDDGSGARMFSNRVTIVLRTEAGTACNIELPQVQLGDQYPNGIPTHIDVVDQTNPDPKAVVASASIGDFDSDGNNDIAAGNFRSEDDTAYAYAYWGGSSIPFDSVDVERFRAGFKQGANLNGVGMIEADHTAQGADALMQINGYPLMLPEIECPDYTAATSPVGSVFESYVSLANNVLTRWINIDGPGVNAWLGSLPNCLLGHIDPFNINLPFLAAPPVSKPIPPRCVDKKPCVLSDGTMLPFFDDDPCCVDACGAMGKKDWVEKCAIYVYMYGHFGRSCPLKEYVYKWGDPSKADCGTWTKNDVPSIDHLNRALAMDDDRGGDAGGETDFASAWQPDTVVSEESNAIANRKDLILAQTLVERETEKTEETIERERAQPSSPFPFMNMTLPLRKLFTLSLGEAPEFSRTVKEMETSESYALMEKEISESILSSLIGAPNSLEMIFMHPVAPLLVGGIAETSKIDLGSEERPNQVIREKMSSGGCSLVADVIASDSEAISDIMNKVRNNISAIATWLWDLLVPSAEAAVCGDGVVEAGEDCDSPQICLQVGPPIGCGFAPIQALCHGPGSATPCKWGCPVCGDGCLTGEVCDKTAYNAINGGCPPFTTCNPTCTACVPTPPKCGNGALDGNEECDPPGKLCPAGQYCTGTCLCAPDIAFGVKLPIGTIMPGHREMTGVLRKGPPKCNYNGVQDPWEECDVAGLSDAAALAQIQAVCPPAVAPAVLDDCDMNDCTCDYRQPQCKLGDPNVQCEKYSDCGTDEICDINCQCVPPPGAGAVPSGLLAEAFNDCYVHADTFSGDAEAEIYKKINDEFRAVTGRQDDLFAEPEQRVTIVCKIGGASAPNKVASDLSLSLSGDPIPDSVDNVRPYMWIQNSGSEFIDSGTLEFKHFELISTPTRILPMEGIDPATQKAKSIVLPDLTSSVDLSSLEGVSPMATTSVAYGTGNTVLINNMLEHRVYSVQPGDVTSAQTIKAQAGQMPSGSAIVIQEVRALLPPDGASWTGTAGYKDLKPIEERELDGELVKKVLKENMAAISGPPTSAIYTGLPWEPNLNYQFGLVQEVYAKAGDPVPPPVELTVGVLAGKPMMMGRGAGCSCNISSGTLGIGTVLPFLLILAVPVAGVTIARVRRRKVK
ncbi:MAG: hypothetical protein ABH871_08885 [Pseudomonadota bacterium]